MVMSARIEDLQSKTKRVQVIFEKEPPPGFSVPGAVHSTTWGPVITAVTRIEDKSQLDEIRKIPGVRINVFPLGLEDIFIDLFGRDAQEEFTETRQGLIQTNKLSHRMKWFLVTEKIY